MNCIIGIKNGVTNVYFNKIIHDTILFKSCFSLVGYHIFLLHYLNLFGLFFTKLKQQKNVNKELKRDV